jgi:hypothetical protein
VGLIQTSHDPIPPPSTKSQTPPSQRRVPENFKMWRPVTILQQGILSAYGLVHSLWSLRKAWHKSALLHRYRQWILLNISFPVVKHNIECWRLTNALYFLPEENHQLLNHYNFNRAEQNNIEKSTFFHQK